MLVDETVLVLLMEETELLETLETEYEVLVAVSVTVMLPDSSVETVTLESESIDTVELTVLESLS